MHEHKRQKTESKPSRDEKSKIFIKWIQREVRHLEFWYALQNAKKHKEDIVLLKDLINQGENAGYRIHGGS